MAYLVEYEMQNIKITKRSLKKDVVSVIFCTAVLVGLALIAQFGTAVCQKMLVESCHAAYDAAEQLVANLHSGVPVQEAVQAFCSEIGS